MNAAPPIKRRKADYEYQHQAALITWARNPATVKKYPGIHLLHASLNGVKLSKAQAGKAWAAGMLAGVPDLFLPVPMRGFNGLFIEMKFGKNRLTEAQRAFREEVREMGYEHITCWTWDEAKETLINYYQPHSFVHGGKVSKPSVTKRVQLEDA